MAAVADEAAKHVTEVSYEPIRLSLTFTFCRPKSHFTTRKGVRTLKDSAPSHKTGKPDCTKLARAVEDALTGIIWQDDSQVVELHVWKVWGDTEGVHIGVRTLIQGDS
jgi:Holliday junction resolvase RusA-like endonuclease